MLRTILDTKMYKDIQATVDSGDENFLLSVKTLGHMACCAYLAYLPGVSDEGSVSYAQTSFKQYRMIDAQFLGQVYTIFRLISSQMLDWCCCI